MDLGLVQPDAADPPELQVCAYSIDWRWFARDSVPPFTRRWLSSIAFVPSTWATRAGWQHMCSITRPRRRKTSWGWRGGTSPPGARQPTTQSGSRTGTTHAAKTAAVVTARKRSATLLLIPCLSRRRKTCQLPGTCSRSGGSDRQVAMRQIRAAGVGRSAASTPRHTTLSSWHSRCPFATCCCGWAGAAYTPCRPSGSPASTRRLMASSPPPLSPCPVGRRLSAPGCT